MGVRPTQCRCAPYALAACGCTSTGTTASADGGDVTDLSTFELRLIPFGLRPGEGRIDVGVASSWNTGRQRQRVGLRCGVLCAYECCYSRPSGMCSEGGQNKRKQKEIPADIRKNEQ
jgi:hypothetical protein